MGVPRAAGARETFVDGVLWREVRGGVELREGCVGDVGLGRVGLCGLGSSGRRRGGSAEAMGSGRLFL